MTRNPLRDAPEALRINAAACDLAVALHAARSDAFGPHGLTFQELPMHIKRAYVEAASAILKATKPVVGLPEDVAGLLPALAQQSMRVVRP